MQFLFACPALGLRQPAVIERWPDYTGQQYGCVVRQVREGCASKLGRIGEGGGGGGRGEGGRGGGEGGGEGGGGGGRGGGGWGQPRSTGSCSCNYDYYFPDPCSHEAV